MVLIKSYKKLKLFFMHFPVNLLISIFYELKKQQIYLTSHKLNIDSSTGEVMKKCGDSIKVGFRKGNIWLKFIYIKVPI